MKTQIIAARETPALHITPETSLKPVLLLSLAAGTISLLVCLKVLGGIPHIPDEMSYLFQGRILASGRLWLSPPPVPEAFVIDHILLRSDRWCSVYPPGWPLLLAIGWLIHAPWLLNPLLLMLSIFGVWRLAGRLYNSRVALLSVVLFSVSPFTLLMASGFMSHQATLCAAVWCLIFLSSESRRLDLLLAGLLAGYAFLIRPYTAITLLAPAFLWSIFRNEKKIEPCFFILSGFLPMLLLFLAYNKLLFGNFLLAGYELDPLWKYEGPGPQLFISKLQWFFKNLNHSLWSLPFPDLLLLIPLLLPHKNWKPDLVLFTCSLSLVICYCFYYYSDIVYSGPRFAYEMTGLIAILAARAVLVIVDRLKVARRDWRVVALLAGVSLFFFPLAIRLPDQIRYHSQFYHGQSEKVIERVNEAGIGKDALILLTGNYYILGSFFFQNALIPQEGDRVFVRDVPSQRAEILKAFPRSETWKVNIELKALRGPNDYADRWILSDFRCEQFKDKILP